MTHGSPKHLASWMPLNEFAVARAKLFAQMPKWRKRRRPTQVEINRIPTCKTTALVEQPVRTRSQGRRGTLQSRFADQASGSHPSARRCQSPGRHALFVSESFHPGWKCTVNGAARIALRVDGDFLGCLCPLAWECPTFAFEFRPASLRIRPACIAFWPRIVECNSADRRAPATGWSRAA